MQLSYSSKTYRELEVCLKLFSKPSLPSTKVFLKKEINCEDEITHTHPQQQKNSQTGRICVQHLRISSSCNVVYSYIEVVEGSLSYFTATACCIYLSCPAKKRICACTCVYTQNSLQLCSMVSLYMKKHYLKKALQV